MSFELPNVPVAHNQFVQHLSRNNSTGLRDLVKPYNEYEAKLREGFAQHREHPAIQDPLVNAVPIYGGHESGLKVRARDPDQDPDAGRYIMPLKAEDRRPEDSPAITASLDEFKSNFKVFSEQSLDDLDWTNVVAAGSAVVTAMLPVPEVHKSSKRSLREYYHERLAPSSDVDLFIWGLDEEAAIKKIAQIETSVRNCILAETTTIRTKNAITIVSQYPVRHIQIVLRLYKSVSEILTGFDVDCSCFAFDGTQVYATPRGITSFCSQINTIDLTRRSPSYESRLAKYARRGFEIFYSDFDRKRIDPTVYERSLVRTLGLARLLILERLPTESDRQKYMNQRRKERGRPELDTSQMKKYQLPENVKDKDPQDVAEWVIEEQVSNYHTFTIPYGPIYNAKKIEKLLYTKDMLLNAEWNHKKDRTVNLHRHPCFIGDVESIVHDCCDNCPVPKTDEELKIAEEEKKIYVQGEIEFMKDDPGRQAIGSFNPLTADDWTDMAYLGNTQELCEFITSGDVDDVKRWCAVEENDVNHRDHTGRMPLHLAVMCGQLEILKVLIENGARITSRVQDGSTSLHMAAAIGRADIIKVLVEKSEENEQMEAEKEDVRKKSRARQQQSEDSQMQDVARSEDVDQESDEDSDEDSEDDSDTEMINASDAETDSEHSGSDGAMTEGSFYKVQEQEDKMLEDDPYGPDFFDINVLSWDAPVSPLHIAILGGFGEVVEALVSSFGADVLLPVKLKKTTRYSATNEAILTLVLASRLPNGRASDIIKRLVGLGAKPSQSDMEQVTAAHGATILRSVDALKAMAEGDLDSTRAGINHVCNGVSSYWRVLWTALITAITQQDGVLVKDLLKLGAKPVTSFEDFREVELRRREERVSRDYDHKELLRQFETGITQPIIHAATSPIPDIVLALLDAGADINTMDTAAYSRIHRENSSSPSTVLDLIRANISSIRERMSKERTPERRIIPRLKPDESYLEGLVPGSYRHTMVSRDLELAKLAAIAIQRECDENNNAEEPERNRKERQQQEARIKELEVLEDELVKRGARGFFELYPKLRQERDEESRSRPNGKRMEHEPYEEFYEINESYNDERLDKEKETAYTKLFEAAWQGDIETVKSLTLRERDDGQGNKLAPLFISAEDSWELNLLSIAMMKGNWALAQVVLDVTAAQYVPADAKKPPKRRFRIRGADDESDDGNGDYNSDMILLTSELVDDNFTIEDLSSLNASAGCRTTPADLIGGSSPLWVVKHPLDMSASVIHRGDSEVWKPSFHWWTWSSPSSAFKAVVSRFWSTESPMGYALETEDVDLIRFLLKAAKEANFSSFKQGTSSSSSEDSWRRQLWVGWKKFMAAGKWDLVKLLITETGVGMPISDMFDSIAIPEEERKKPNSYQGLKIRGKHRADWAVEAGGEKGPGQGKPWQERNTSPFLDAVRSGSLEEVSFWRGDECVKMYEEFGQRHQHVESIQRISKAYGSWKKAVTTWINIRNNLALHCAVLGGAAQDKLDKDQCFERVQYLLKHMPNTINKKANNGCSPLWLAYSSHQVEIARLLIDAGADQTVRDNKGRNILHALLLWDLQTNTEKEPDREQKDLEKMEALLNLIDPSILADLFTGRCSVGSTGLSPFAAYIHSRKRHLSVLRLLDRYMPAEVYTMFDGSGQTPAHQLVIDHSTDGTKEMLEEIATLHPLVLMQDNAMGQLPVELAWALYLRHQTKEPPKVYMARTQHVGEMRIPSSEIQPRPKYFLGDNASIIRLYSSLRDLMEKAEESGQPLKRHMISVRDAREVARRLAERAGGEEAGTEDFDEVKIRC